MIYSGIPIVVNDFEAFEGQVERIYLYEFWPTRFILHEEFNIRECGSVNIVFHTTFCATHKVARL